ASARGGVDYFREHRLFSIAPGWIGGYPSYTGPGDFSRGGSEGNEIFATQTTTSTRLDAVRTIAGMKWNFAVGADVVGSRERIRTAGVDSILHVPSAGAPDTARVPPALLWTGHARETSALGEAGVTLSNGANVRVGLRNEWTSDVPGQHASSLLPSVSAAIDLVRAVPSMRDCCYLSAATLRGSLWRDAGDLSPYVAQTMYAGGSAGGSVAPAGGSPLVADVNLEPELTTGWEIGADLALEAPRISLGFTAYSEKTSGVILPVSDGLVARNAGEIRNRGIEGSLTSRMGNGDVGFQWDLTLNAGRNSNEVLSLIDNVQSIPLGPSQWGLSVEARRGLPLGALVGRRMLRDVNGALLLRDGLPLPDSVRGAEYLGDALGKGTLGVRSSLRYRWVTASIAADGRFGGHVYSGTNLWGSYSGVLEATAFRPDSGLLIAGVDATTGQANATHVTTQDYYHALAAIQEPWVYSASFFKIRDARLSFTLPSRSRTLPFQGASVSLVVRNLYTWANAPNIDPETIFSVYQLPGVEMGQLPSTRSIGIQLTVTP
ncbi:MAG TPA: TonB-dependent receptor, partial [Gemmatimonadaceae bacterium]